MVSRDQALFLTFKSAQIGYRDFQILRSLHPDIVDLKYFQLLIHLVTF